MPIPSKLYDSNPARVVIGPRDVLLSYCHKPWPEVVAAAEQGLDGLTFGRDSGQFSRSAPTDHSLSLGSLTGLLEQNW